MPELRQLDGLLLTEPPPRGPRAIGPYRVVRPIANGGIGRVFLVEHEGGAVFAMKVLHQHLRTAPLETALIAEGRITLGLGLVRALCAVDLVESEPAIVMPFVESRALDALEDSGGARRWRALVDALEGLAACHARGIVHRDVCPSNILVDATGRGHLIDFGLAWNADGYVTDPEGGTQGTFAYLAPEQVRAESPAPLVDIFSCGVIAWEIAAGRRLHPQGNTAKTLLDVTGRDAPSLEGEGCATALANVIARAVARDPGMRTASAATFADDLRAALPSSGVQL